jgi:serine protease
MKIHLPRLLIFLASYAVEARHLTTDGPPESQSPVTPQPDSDRFIVRYKNRQGKFTAQAAAKKVYHADLGPQSAMAITLSSDALEGLQKDPNIAYVEQDHPLSLMTMRGYHSTDVFKEHMMENKETHGENHRKLTETVPYGIPMVQADQVSYNSSNPRTVCIIDSGYDLGHEDLPNTNVNGYNGNLPWNQDGDGHGTHVAGK